MSQSTISTFQLFADSNTQSFPDIDFYRNEVSFGYNLKAVANA